MSDHGASDNDERGSDAEPKDELTVCGGGEGLKNQQEFWGGRASRALESLGGCTSGRTSYENEKMRRDWIEEQRGRNLGMEVKTAAKVGTGESRASLKRKKKKGVGEGPKSRAQAEQDNLRARLSAFYKIHAPEKLTTMEAMLAKFRGDEASLFRLLVTKYGAEPTKDDLEAAERRGARDNEARRRRADQLLDEYDRLAAKRARKAKFEAEQNEVFDEEAAALTGGAGGMEGLEALNAANVKLFMKHAREKPTKRGT